VVVDAGTRASDGSDNVIARPELGHISSDFFYAAEALMSDHQEVVAFCAVFGGIDLLIGSVHSDS
jgi:hypothetical protein